MVKEGGWSVGGGCMYLQMLVMVPPFIKHCQNEYLPGHNRKEGKMDLGVRDTEFFRGNMVSESGEKERANYQKILFQTPLIYRTEEK